MGYKTPQIRVLFSHSRIAVRLLVLGVFLFVAVSATIGSLYNPSRVQAATTNTLNFQARLQTAAGGQVADGFYNIQFKLYDAAAAGTNVWTESYLDVDGSSGTTADDFRVRVKNGYLTVNLGSRTSFPTTINWDQQLWITMNVGGTAVTASPTYDGEMNPRLKLTAVPYAFRAGQLATGNGTLQSTLSIVQPTVGNQIFQIQDQAAAGTYNLCIQNSAACGFIQNQLASAQAANIFLQSASSASNPTVQIQLASGQSGDLLQFRNSLGALIGKVDSSANIAVGNFVDIAGTGPFLSFGAGATILDTRSASNLGLVVKGQASQSGDLIQLQNNSGNSLAGFSSAGQLYLGRSSGAVGSMKLFNSTNANTVTIQSGATGANYTLTLPTAAPALSQCLQNDGTTVGTLVFATCGAVGAATSVGAISNTSTLNGGSISGGVLTLNVADGTNGGVLSAAANSQTIGGAKTFSGSVTTSASVTHNLGAANQVAITSGTNVPTADQLSISNIGSTGVTTTGINGLSIDYKGGAAAVESAGARINLTAGGTSGGTWSGVRVAPTSGAAAGVTENGIKIDAITGTAGTENAFYVGTGWDNILSYNGGSIINGTGVLQSAGLSGTYSNALTLNNASNAFTGVGTNLTALNASNLSSGTVGTSLLSGNYSGITGVGSITSGTVNGQTISSAASLTGSLAVAGAVTLNGNTTIGDATSDRLTLTAQVLGASPIVLQGATDNAFTTTLALIDPTANNTITLPNASGTVAVSATGNIALSAAGQISLTGTVGLGNGGTNNTSYTTNGVIYSNGTSLVSTAAGTSGDCLKSNGSGAAPSYGTCGTGSANTVQDTYNASGPSGTTPQIQLSGTNGGLKIRDAASTVGNLFQLQNSTGTTSYFAVSATGATMQDASANNAFVFDSSGDSHLRLYANTTTPTLYADIYYDTANSEAVFAASSGTTRVGNGSGNIQLQLTNAADVLLSTKTVTLGAAYSANDFSFTRAITAGTNSLTGNVVKIESTSTGTGTLANNLLLINENNTANTTGTLILATTGGAGNTKFQVNTAGTVSIAAGQAYTGAGAVNLNSAAATNLTLSAGTTGSVIAKAATNSTASFRVQDSSSLDLLVGDTTGKIVQIGNATTDANAILLTLDSYNNATDPTGSNGAMYYNSSLAAFRCRENGSWYNCLTRHIVTLGSDVTNSNATANTIADVTGMSFAVTSGVTYRFHALINYTSAVTTTGSRWAINGPATTTLSYTSNYTLTATSATTNYAAAYNTPATSNASSLTTGNIAIIDGIITPSASGTVTVRFASEISSSAIVAKAGSTIEWW